MKGSRVLGGSMLLLACHAPSTPTGTTRRVEITAPGLPHRALDSLRIEPPGIVQSAVRVGDRLKLSLDGNTERVVIHAQEACSLQIPPASPGSVTRLRLVPLFTLSGPETDVGFDAPFQIAVRAGCRAASRGRVAWSLEGEALAAFSIEESGTRVVGRTRRMPERLASWPKGRIVPVSAAERGETLVTARWTSPTGTVVARSIRIVAAPRSSGLPNVALGKRVLLSGLGFRVLKRPIGAYAEVMPWGNSDGPLSSIVPDVAGRWELGHPSGKTLSIHIDRYDAVPLDCGQTPCHAAESHAIQSSPMSTSFSELLDSPAATGAIACTFGCHTTGEPGPLDGGFSAALSEFELDAAHLPAWSELPRSLRRMGGVGCMACHGPTQMPEPDARWGILRAEVCATCHDAPPRYRHVESWRTSQLAQSDRHPQTRIHSRCAACHTTWGFLESLSGTWRGYRMPPDDEPPIGISCVACHAVHAEQALQPGLLRRVRIDPGYSNLPTVALERSGACIFCHQPDEAGGPSSALIWAGQGALDPLSGGALIGPAPHAAVPGGCVGCHGAPSQHSRAQDHTFKVDPAICTRCHAGRPIDRSIFMRARHLLAGGGIPMASDLPPHARQQAPFSARDRALDLARLVVEDRGAAVHNPAYAAALLDRAASVLSLPDPVPDPPGGGLQLAPPQTSPPPRRGGRIRTGDPQTPSLVR